MRLSVDDTVPELCAGPSARDRPVAMHGEDAVMLTQPLKQLQSCIKSGFGHRFCTKPQNVQPAARFVQTQTFHPCIVMQNSLTDPTPFHILVTIAPTRYYTVAYSFVKPEIHVTCVCMFSDAALPEAVASEANCNSCHSTPQR